ncbi:MAG: haloalkane dehalogenase [Actinomycetes bacterium]
MEVFRTPDERFEGLPGYPFDPNYVEVSVSGLDYRLHHLDEGDGPVVLCFHGQPAWSYLYRKMVSELVATGHRVVCPDLVGMGRSDKPLDQEWYSYSTHSESLAAHLAAIDGLEDVTAVVHDWGGLLGLKWVADHMDQVGRLVVMNTSLSIAKASEPFMAWRNFVSSTPDLPVGKILQAATVNELSDEVVAGYDAPFPTPESKAAAQRFPLLVPLEPTDPGAAEMAAARETLRGFTGPSLVAFSDRDPMFPFPRAAEYFTETLPTAGEPVCITGGHHFLQEDQPHQIVEAMFAAFGKPIGS